MGCESSDVVRFDLLQGQMRVAGGYILHLATDASLVVLGSGIASIFVVDYSSNFPTNDRPIIDFVTPL